MGHTTPTREEDTNADALSRHPDKREANEKNVNEGTDDLNLLPPEERMKEGLEEHPSEDYYGVMNSIGFVRSSEEIRELQEKDPLLSIDCIV